MNYPPFYIGQKVVALCNYFGEITKDETYTVSGLEQFSCGCWLISLVGIVRIGEGIYCGFHPDVINLKPNLSLFSATRFSPIIEKFESISFEKVVEKELVSVN